MTILSNLVALIMLGVSLIHFYWAFGGQYGLKSAGPTIEGIDDFKPPAFIIFIVAVLLLGLAILSIQFASPWEPIKDYISYVGYLVSFIFVVRSIGDFKYVGFFKKVYNSNFAKLDTWCFSPLILFLGVSYAVLSIFY